MMVHKLIGRNAPVRDTEAVNCNGLPRNSCFGIEIEWENFNALANVLAHEGTKYWKLEGDGSLKHNGIELILNRPLAGHNLLAAMNELKERLNCIKRYKDMPTAGVRTSVHFHMNVSDISTEHLLNLLCLYTVFEKTIYRLGGKHRAYNNNCIPVSDSFKFQQLVSNLAQDKRFGCTQGFEKYAGLNIGSIFQPANDGNGARGSLEFRMHEGTTDLDRIIDFVKFLVKLKDASKDINIHELIGQVSMKGPIEYAFTIFDQFTNYMLTFYEESGQMEMDIYAGIRTLQYILDENLYNKSCSDIVDDLSLIDDVDLDDDFDDDMVVIDDVERDEGPVQKAPREVMQVIQEEFDRHVMFNMEQMERWPENPAELGIGLRNNNDNAGGDPH